MRINQAGSLRYYSFESFPNDLVLQGVFTRHGGVSPEPWASLNHGGMLGDPHEHQVENRRRVFDGMDRSVESIYDVWQVHGTRVICAEAPRHLDSVHEKADVIITNRPEITLFMRFADCVPIFLLDPVRKAVGIVHAGWRGTVNQGPAAAVAAMHEHFGSNPADILAGIGPSIGPDHYEVGPEVINEVKNAFGPEMTRLLVNSNGKLHLNLWETNRLVLNQAGVHQVELAGICTACHVEDWYSHRAEDGKTGRFGALLALKN